MGIDTNVTPLTVTDNAAPPAVERKRSRSLRKAASKLTGASHFFSKPKPQQGTHTDSPPNECASDDAHDEPPPREGCDDDVFSPSEANELEATPDDTTTTASSTSSPATDETDEAERTSQVATNTDEEFVAAETDADAETKEATQDDQSSSVDLTEPSATIEVVASATSDVEAEQSAPSAARFECGDDANDEEREANKTRDAVVVCAPHSLPSGSSRDHEGGCCFFGFTI